MVGSRVLEEMKKLIVQTSCRLLYSTVYALKFWLSMWRFIKFYFHVFDVCVVEVFLSVFIFSRTIHIFFVYSIIVFVIISCWCCQCFIF